MSWWRHQMEIFSALQALCAGIAPITGEFPAQRPVTRGFDAFFDLRLNIRLSKQWWGWWSETPSHPLWRRCNVLADQGTQELLNGILCGDYWHGCVLLHYGDVIIGTIASQITSLTIVYSTIYSDADQRKHQSSASLAFVRGIHRGPVNFPQKWPVTRKMFPFDDVIMWAKKNIVLEFIS